MAIFSRALIVLCAIGACAGSPVFKAACFSQCGMELMVSSANCDEFFAAETRAVEALHRVYPHICAYVRGAIVTVNESDAGWWTDQWGRNVAGLSSCIGPTIEVNTANWRKSSLTHEIAHLAECPIENVEHVGWQDAGIFQAIDEANK